MFGPSAVMALRIPSLPGVLMFAVLTVSVSGVRAEIPLPYEPVAASKPFRFLDFFRAVIAGEPASVSTPATAPDIDSAADLITGLAADAEQTRQFREKVMRAVTANPEFDERHWRGREAAGRTAEARAALKPQLSGGLTTGLGFFDGDANDNRRSVADEGTTTEADLFVNAEQQLYDFGATGHQIAATEAARRGIDAETRTIAGRLTFDTVSAWLDMARVNAREALIAENLAIHELVLTYAEQRREAGVGATTDVVQANAQFASARASAAGFSAGRVDARSRFFELFSAPPDGTEGLPAPVLELPLHIDDAREQALASSPRMASARLISAQRLHERRAADAAYLPSLTLQVRATRFDVLNGQGDYELSGRVVGQVTIDTSGAIGARADQAHARHIQATRVLAMTRRSLEREVTTAFQTLAERRDEVASYESALLENHRSRMAVLEQFRLRGVSLLQVLRAQEDYFSVAMRYIDARVSVQVARFELARALGRIGVAFDVSGGSGE